MENYINTKTFEISWDMPDYIPCDDEIAEAIAILNQKGYKTLYSCAGHNRVFEKYIVKCSKEEKEDLLKNKNRIYIIEEDNQYLYYVPKITTTDTYVCFKESIKYVVDNLPNGFKYEEYEDEDTTFYTIRCVHEMYKDEECKIRKSNKEIDEHIKNAQGALYEWAKSLKDLNIKKKLLI